MAIDDPIAPDSIFSASSLNIRSSFLVMLPQVVAVLKDTLPQSIANQAGLQLVIFGFVLLLLILFEPGGINEIWVKIKYYMDVFPMYSRGTFKRQKSFTKAETW